MSRHDGFGIGVVGCGRATEDLHLPALRKLNGMHVVALSDIDDARLTHVAARFGIRQRYRDYRELITDASIDIVAVCVPAAYHEPITCAALEADKHVYVEKPLALTDRGASAMVHSAARAVGKSTMGFNLRSHRLVRRAKEIVVSGALGRIELLRTTWTSGFHYGREWTAWRYRRADGGGALFEMAVHHADLWRFLLDDEVARVYSESRSEGGSDDVSASITACMTKGALVSAAFCERTSDSNEIEVYGQKGVLRFSLYRADSLALHPTADLAGGPRARMKQLARRLSHLPTTFAVSLRGGDYLQSYGMHWQSFIQSIRDRTPPPCTLEDGQQALRIVLAAIESTQQGQPVAMHAHHVQRNVHANEVLNE